MYLATMIENEPLRIAYAEDHTIVRKGIVALLNDMGGLQVDIESDNGIDLIAKIQKAKIAPDVCIIDINMPGMNGFDTIIELKKKWPKLGVLVLTVFDIEYYFIRMIMSGANGYLLKSCDPDEIRKAIVTIHKEGMYYSDMVTRNYFHAIMNKEIKLPNLTPMEVLVLKQCCSDLSYSQIAEQMNTTSRSVEGYRDSLFKKLNVNSRVSLAMFAVQFGIVPVDMYTSEQYDFLNKKTK